MAKQDVLWNFYKKGMISNEALAEVNRVNLDKDMRRKKVETGPIATCKSEQMAVYATLQIVESLFTKIDELFYGTYKGSITASQTTNQYVINVQKQMSTVMQGLKTSETNLRNAVSQSSVNTAKLLKQETLRINKIISLIEKSGAKSGVNKNLVENFRSDLKKATKVIREGSTSDLKELEQTIIRTLHKRDEAFVKAVGEQYKDLVNEIGKQKKSEKRTPDLSPEIKEQLTGLTENLDLIGDRIEGLQGSIVEYMEAKEEGGEVGDLGKVMETLEDNAQENAELNEAQTQMLMEQMALMQSEVEAYQKTTDKKLDGIQTRVDKAQKASKDEISKEVKDLRGLLNSMRADIELMKTIVSKMGK
jgi:hypothetical protein